MTAAVDAACQHASKSEIQSLPKLSDMDSSERNTEALTPWYALRFSDWYGWVLIRNVR